MSATITTTDLEAGTWTIDAVHSSVTFSVRHLMVSKVRGRFEAFSGAIIVDEKGVPSVTADIDIASISTGNEGRDAHIRSADYFEVEKFPTATFVSTAVRADGDDYAVDGDFTLHGVTRPVTLKLEFNGVSAGMGQGPVAGFEASVVLSRKEFGIDLDMPLETGGSVIGDKITINLEIEASKTA